jgi:hypothetical protein
MRPAFAFVIADYDNRDIRFASCTARAFSFEFQHDGNLILH